MIEAPSQPSLEELNDHPLNRAAKLLLQKQGESPQSLPPGIMPLLVLATNRLHEENELNDRAAALSQWSQDQASQRKALNRLSAVLKASDLLAGTPDQAADQVLAELAPENPPPPLS